MSYSTVSPGCVSSPSSLSAANLPHLYAFSDGESGTHISDGGNDMYDGGNRIQIKHETTWSSDLNYRQICGGSSMMYVQNSDVKYTTCTRGVPPEKFFVASFHSETNGITGIRVQGNLGCDGAGSVGGSGNGSPLVYMFNGITFYGHYKKIWCNHDPSVNHLFISRKSGSHTFFPSTDNDSDTLEFQSGQNALYYVMWAGRYNNQGVNYSEAQFQAVMEKFVQSCENDFSFYSSERSTGFVDHGVVQGLDWGFPNPVRTVCKTPEFSSTTLPDPAALSACGRSCIPRWFLVNVINMDDPDKGYLDTYGNANRGGFGVVTSPTPTRNNGSGTWRIIFGADELRFGSTVVLINEFDPKAGYLGKDWPNMRSVFDAMEVSSGPGEGKCLGHDNWGDLYLQSCTGAKNQAFKLEGDKLVVEGGKFADQCVKADGWFWPKLKPCDNNDVTQTWQLSSGKIVTYQGSTARCLRHDSSWSANRLKVEECNDDVMDDIWSLPLQTWEGNNAIPTGTEDFSCYPLAVCWRVESADYAGKTGVVEPTDQVYFKNMQNQEYLKVNGNSGTGGFNVMTESSSDLASTAAFAWKIQVMEYGGDACTHCVDGMCYRSLENMAWTKDSSAIKCQNYWKEMPEGWEIASHRCDILEQFGWNTHLMCFSDDRCYATKNWAAGWVPCTHYPWFDGYVKRDGNRYRPGGCTAGTMIQRPAAGFVGGGCNEAY